MTIQGEVAAMPHTAFRKHIAIVGRRNVGKSSLINAIAGQDIALVSDVPVPPPIRSIKPWKSNPWDL